MMYLTAISVRGYKSLRQTNVDDIARITAFIGSNNSGKSAILESLVFLSFFAHQKYSIHLMRRANPDEWFRDVTTDHTEQPADITVELALSKRDEMDLEQAIDGLSFGKNGFGSQLTVRFAAGSPDDPQEISLREMIWSFRSQEFAYVSRQEGTKVLPDLNNMTKLLPGKAVRIRDDRMLDVNYQGVGHITGPPQTHDPSFMPLRMVANWTRNLRWLGPERSFSTAASVQGPVPSEPSELPRALQDLYNNDRAMFDKMEQILSQLVPGTKQILVPITENMTTTVRVVSDHADWALIHGGHGISSMLSTVLELTKAPVGATVLLEEPETGIHPGAQRALAELMEAFTRDRNLQILLATHSPVFARDTQDCATIAVRLTKAGTNARRIRRQEFQFLKHELGALNSDLFMANLVLFCEDDSAYHFFPSVFQLLGLDMAGAGIYLMPLHGVGKGRIMRLREYLNYLGSNDVRHFAVLDDDEGVRPAINKLVRDGLLSKRALHIWSKDRKAAEFEDNFDSDALITAANALAAEAGVEPKLEATELTNRTVAAGGTKVSKVLQRYYREAYDYDLSKPKLAAMLAQKLTAKGSASIPRPFQTLVRKIRAELNRVPSHD